MRHEFKGNVHYNKEKFAKGDEVPAKHLAEMQAAGLVESYPSDADRAEAAAKSKGAKQKESNK